MLNQEFRPKTFTTIVGQGDIPVVLKNQVRQKQIGHAYLFTGNRGSGKTSSARVLAKAVNCINPVNGDPCGVCKNCQSFEKGTFVDLHELDAATHNGVDNIRKIIDEVVYSPQMGEYKVYIMDEVHMLSQGAVNAFLKTLEEPPKHVIFILCTTDPQKLPITILSRCQRFDFKRIKLDIIYTQLKNIANAKKIKIDDAGLFLIAKLADGAMRDALSLLDQVISCDTGNGITYQQLVSILGVSSSEVIIKLISEILSSKTLMALETFNSICEDGKDMYIFLQDFIKSYRNVLIAKVDKDAEKLINASELDIKRYRELATTADNDKLLYHIHVLQDCERDFKLSSNQRTLIEMALIKMTAETSENILLKRIEQLQKQLNEGHLYNRNMPTHDLYNSSESSPNTEEYSLGQDSFIESNETMIDEEKEPYVKEVKITKELENAKNYVVSKFLEHEKVEAGLALDNSEIDLVGDILYIKPTIHADLVLLTQNIKNICNGFSSALEFNLNVEIKP